MSDNRIRIATEDQKKVIFNEVAIRLARQARPEDRELRSYLHHKVSFVGPGL